MDLFAGYDVAVALIAIMLAVSGIVLGLGIAVDDRKLKEFGKSEIQQAVINGMIVGTLFLAFSQYGAVTQIINSVVASSSISVQCDPLLASNQALCFAYSYLTSPFPIAMHGGTLPSLLDSVLSLLIPTTLLTATVGLISSFQFSFIITVGLGAALKPLVNQLNYIVTALTFALMSIEVQGALIKFISVVAMPVLLPIGMVLRSFYPTRKTGGALMAIAIGLFAVFPLTYVLDAQMTYSYSLGTATALLNSTVASAHQFQNSILNSSVISGNGISFNPVNAVSNAVNGFVSGNSTLIQGMVDVLSLLIVQVFFFPIFSIIITIIAIRELAKLLGSEISFGKFDVF